MIDKIYKGLIFEAENFFVNKFFESKKIENAYKRCIDTILSPASKLGVLAYDTKYGQGKTFFFRLLHSYMRRNHKMNIYKEVSAKELVDIYKAGGEESLSKAIETVRNLFIDDLGEELGDGNAKSYGNSLNVLKYVILKRYELWEKKGFKLHATSNLTIEQMSQSYGGRAADRLMQITEVVSFDFSRNSFRQVKSLRPLTEAEKKANEEKLKPKDKVEKVDVIGYLNELLQEPKGVLEDKDIYYFTFILNHLIKANGLELTEPTDEELGVAEWHARQSIKHNIRTLYRHTTADVRSTKKDEALSKINNAERKKVAHLIQVKKLLMSMRDNNETFIK